MQTDSKREKFNIVLHGEWRPGRRHLLVGGHAMMNHFALTRNAPDNMHIVDNFLVNPYVGLDYSGATALDSLTVKAGALLTVERNRVNDLGWQTPGGAWLEVLGQWRWFGLKNRKMRRLYTAHPDVNLLRTLPQCRRNILVDHYLLRRL